MSGGSDEADVDELATAAEAADDDVTRDQRRLAIGYLVALFTTIAAAIAAAIYLGLVDISLSVNASVNVGWVVEYLVIGMVALFLSFTIAMVFVALPGSVLGGMVRIAGGIWQAYGGDDGSE